MKTWKIFLLILTFAFFSCKEETNKTSQNSVSETEEIDHLETAQPDKAHTSENALDWAGTYKGVFPCADCPGIETMLDLNNDQTYSMQMNYLERDGDFHSTGKFEWDENGQVITLHPEDKNDHEMKFFVGENLLFQLDDKGKRMKKEDEKNYTLVKEME